MALYYKFPGDRDAERCLKIGQYLTKLHVVEYWAHTVDILLPQTSVVVCSQCIHIFVHFANKYFLLLMLFNRRNAEYQSS